MGVNRDTFCMPKGDHARSLDQLVMSALFHKRFGC